MVLTLNYRYNLGICGVITLSETINTINKRRSIRAYEKKSISAEEKNTIINSTLRSPTAGNMMLYSIIEVADQTIKEKLVKSCDNQPFIARSPFVLLFLADYQRWMDYFKVSDVESLIEREDITPRMPQVGDLMLACCDALIAAQTAVIAAESIGIGSCYIGDIMDNFEFHKELFESAKIYISDYFVVFWISQRKITQKRIYNSDSRNNIFILKINMKD